MTATNYKECTPQQISRRIIPVVVLAVLVFVVANLISLQHDASSTVADEEHMDRPSWVPPKKIVHSNTSSVRNSGHPAPNSTINRNTNKKETIVKEQKQHQTQQQQSKQREKEHMPQNNNKKTVPPEKVKRYFDIADEVFYAARHILFNSETAFSKARVVANGTTTRTMEQIGNHTNATTSNTNTTPPSAHFSFPLQEICKDTCCAKQVAIASLANDEHHLLNTMDGLDLADIIVRYREGPKHLTFHASLFHEEMLPCLQPGTIIHLNNKGSILLYFWKKVRPRIQVPFILITSDSDHDSPFVGDSRFGVEFAEDWGQYLDDPLLIKWYGSNPKYSSNPNATSRPYETKFEPMHLGLSKRFPQAKYLSKYLALTNYANPFEPHLFQAENGDTNVSTSELDFDWRRDVFVFFGLKRKQRKRLWNIFCSGVPSTNNATMDSLTNMTIRTSTTELVSCNITAGQGRNLSPHDIYAHASRYRFGISPPGNGWDCFRTYELLYLGVIPIIEERDPESRRLFEGLPVVHMPSLNSAPDLESFTAAIQDSINEQEQQQSLTASGWERLFLAYWRRKILADAKRDTVFHDGTEYYLGWQYTSKSEDKIYCRHEGNCEVNDTPAD